MTANDITVWNYENQDKPQFTKKEHSNAKGICAEEIWLWNKCLPSAEKYSKKEHSNAKGFSVYETKLWNKINKKNIQKKKFLK